MQKRKWVLIRWLYKHCPLNERSTNEKWTPVFYFKFMHRYKQYASGEWEYFRMCNWAHLCIPYVYRIRLAISISARNMSESFRLFAGYVCQFCGKTLMQANFSLMPQTNLSSLSFKFCTQTKEREWETGRQRAHVLLLYWSKKLCCRTSLVICFRMKKISCNSPVIYVRMESYKLSGYIPVSVRIFRVDISCMQPQAEIRCKDKVHSFISVFFFLLEIVIFGRLN